MRISPVNNTTYIKKRQNNSVNLSNLSFNGYFASRRVSNFLTQNIPYDNPDTRSPFMVFCGNSDFAGEKKLIELAKSLLTNSTEISDTALFAAHFLLFGVNNGTLSKLENKDKILSLLKKIVEINDHSLVLDIETPEDMDLFLKANPEIDVNKHYYCGIRTGYSLLLKAAKFNKTELLKYLVNREDIDLYKYELWMHLTKHSERTHNMIREIPKEKFSLEQFEQVNGYNLLMCLLSKGYDKTVPEPYMGDRNFQELYRGAYDKNGTFTLDEMERIVDYRNFKKFVNARINIVGDGFGHLLSDIEVKTPEELKKLKKIIKRMQESGYPFNKVNDLNQTPLDRAIEAENQPVENLIRQMGVYK